MFYFQEEQSVSLAGFFMMVFAITSQDIMCTQLRLMQCVVLVFLFLLEEI